MIRTLIVDDSPTSRMLLAGIVDSDPSMKVIAEAGTGREAIELAQRLHPDLITMDVRMPGMNGFEASLEIMSRCPTPIVIVTAGTNVDEVETAMNVLRAGALAAHKLPPAPGTSGFEAAAKEILMTLKAMAAVKVITHRKDSRARLPQQGQAHPRPSLLGMPVNHSAEKPRIVAVAASTGGPNAVSALLSRLPASFPVPILLVQHITAGFIGGYAHWLNSDLSLRVKVAVHGELLLGGTVYVAPDDFHLGVDPSQRVMLSKGPPVAGFRPSANSLFSSVATAYGPASVSIILTGMGSDGVAGLRDIRQAGGHIFAQDEGSCVVFGMPKAAIDSGLVKRGAPPDEIAARLTHLVCGQRQGVSSD